MSTDKIDAALVLIEALKERDAARTELAEAREALRGLVGAVKRYREADGGWAAFANDIDAPLVDVTNAREAAANAQAELFAALDALKDGAT